MSKMKDLHYDLWSAYDAMSYAINRGGIERFLKEMPPHLKEELFQDIERKLDIARMSSRYQKLCADER